MSRGSMTPGFARVNVVALSISLLGSSLSPWAYAQQVTTTSFGYDAAGNATSITDPRGMVTNQSFDNLDRLTQQLQPPAALGGTRPAIGVGYDGLDQVRTVTDPRSLVTTYTVNGLGDRSSLVSPDTSTTGRTFDAAGNVKTETDARGKTTTYTYDALNRLTLADYPVGTDTSLEWDGGASPPPNSRGRLTRITDESGSTVYTYNGFGQVLTKTQTIGSGTAARTRVTTYAYGTSGTSLGRLTSITYPSANRINFTYDTAGRIASITLNPTNTNGTGTNTGSTINLLTSIAYEPFGSARSWTWGNGAAYSRTFDLDGRITSYPLGHPSQSGLVRTVTWDAASRVTGYTHVNGSNVAQPTFNQTFGYDDLNRLTSWTASSTSQAYQYDLTGNRTQLTIGATNHAYTVASTSNRLSSTAGPAPAQTNTYDAAGNVTANGSVTFTYSDRGRMSRATIGTNQVNYLYNGLGQRVRKQGPTSLVPTGTHLYTYDEGGRLIGEYDNTATPRVRQETVYLGDTPVAVLTQTVSGSPAVFTTVVNYVYADHIDTPRVITQASDNRMRWRWDQADPFGTSAPNQNPASIGAFTYNPRFPGQFYDVESNLHYNYFRDYDPRIGRYLQSDPIGLAAGINTYAYAEADPLRHVDPDGRFAQLIPMLTTGVIGGISSAGAYALSNFARGCDINVGEFFVAGGVGFLAGLTMPYVGLVGNAVVGGSANLLQDVINKGSDMSPLEALESFGWGAAGAAAGGSYSRGVGMGYGTRGDRRWVDRSNAMRDLARNTTGTSIGRQFASNFAASYGNTCSCPAR